MTMKLAIRLGVMSALATSVVLAQEKETDRKMNKVTIQVGDVIQTVTGDSEHQSVTIGDRGAVNHVVIVNRSNGQHRTIKPKLPANRTSARRCIEIHAGMATIISGDCHTGKTRHEPEEHSP